MLPEDWDAGFGRTLGVFLNGDGIRGRDARGERITDLNFLIYFNAHDDVVEFTLPGAEYADAWETVVDTAGAGADSEPRQGDRHHPRRRQGRRRPARVHVARRRARPLRRRVAGLGGRVGRCSRPRRRSRRSS